MKKALPKSGSAQMREFSEKLRNRHLVEEWRFLLFTMTWTVNPKI